jgi:hypothetical protein
MLTLREQERQRTERLRGWVINFLYLALPSPMELPMLMRLLDRQNFPLSRRRLAEQLDYLSSIRLLRVFAAGDSEERDAVQQAKLIQRYAETESDSEMGLTLCARLTAVGVNFQEGLEDRKGIHRVE